MTRKRYIRMLMAEGIQRNDAHEMAWCIQKAGIPYNDAFLSRLNVLYIVFNVYKGMEKSVIKHDKSHE